MEKTEDIKYKLELIEKNIENHSKNKSKLVVVTKTQTIDKITEVYNCGYRDFGENKVQEFIEKYEYFKNKEINWHMIGHIQRNKVKYIIDKVYLIHSLDSIRLAEEINKRAKQIDKNVNVLIQLNISKEESKYGILLEELDEFLEKIKGFSNLNIKGLMTMAPYYSDPEETRIIFKKMHDTYTSLKNKEDVFENLKMEYLSMGMTNDYNIALEEGSNLIRVGRSIFGER